MLTIGRGQMVKSGMAYHVITHYVSTGLFRNRGEIPDPGFYVLRMKWRISLAGLI